MAAFLSVGTISLYLCIRLVTLVRAEVQSSQGGSSQSALYNGVLMWLRELREAVVSRVPANVKVYVHAGSVSDDKKGGVTKDPWSIVDGYQSNTSKTFEK